MLFFLFLFLHVIILKITIKIKKGKGLFICFQPFLKSEQWAKIFWLLENFLGSLLYFFRYLLRGNKDFEAYTHFTV